MIPISLLQSSPHLLNHLSSRWIHLPLWFLLGTPFMMMVVLFWLLLFWMVCLNSGSARKSCRWLHRKLDIHHQHHLLCRHFDCVICRFQSRRLCCPCLLGVAILRARYQHPLVILDLPFHRPPPLAHPFMRGLSIHLFKKMAVTVIFFLMEMTLRIFLLSLHRRFSRLF
jgi:hypothetical protein